MPEVARSFHHAPLSGTASKVASVFLFVALSVFDFLHAAYHQSRLLRKGRLDVTGYPPVKAARNARLASSIARLLTSKGKPKNP
jgi:hypothetical protein